MILRDLCWKLSCIKEDEQNIKKEREAIEEKIVALILDLKTEGTTTQATDGYKVSVTTKLNRKLDVFAYEALQLPPNIQFVDYKPEINLKRLRAVEMIDPTITAACVTTTPAKTSVKIEEVSE